MKKSFLLLATLLMLGSSAFAIGGLDFCVGPKVGYQTARLSYQKEDIKASFANMYVLGLFGRIEIGNIYVQPEALWFKSSNAFDMNINKSEAEALGYNYPNGIQFTMTRKAMNIQVPVFVGYKLNLLDFFAIRPQIGPTANFVIPEKTVVEKSASIGEGDFPEQLENAEFDTKSIAWGVQMGLGFDLFGFTLDINYNLGITKIFGADIIEGLDNEWVNKINLGNIEKTRQNLFMVTVGYRFL